MIGDLDESPSGILTKQVILNDKEYVDAYVTYRAFWPHRLNGVVSLQGSTYDTIWEPGISTARCNDFWTYQLGMDHVVPARWCGCGIHGFRSPKSLYWKFNRLTHIMAEIVQWGRMQIHTAGIRSEFAQVSALLQPFSDQPSHELEAMLVTTELASVKYDVPIVEAPGDQDHLLHLQLNRLQTMHRHGIAIGDLLAPWRSDLAPAPPRKAAMPHPNLWGMTKRAEP